MQPLPIDQHLPEILRTLRTPRVGGSLVLEAPPGAGKTTRVPYAIRREAWCTGQVLVTEPRRIAARLSAGRVAEERRLTLGKEVGYRVRFDDRTGPNTELIYLTEGLLLRRLLGSDGLAGVSAVIFDEVHEQSADLEVALGLVTRLQRQRPDLRLVAMSATLDAEHISKFWDGAARLTSPGRAFEVTVRHDAAPDERPLPIRVRSAVRTALERSGDILVFLPGAAEIRACEDALNGQVDADVVPLHGDLPIEAQARAVQAGGEREGARPRVVLSTNVAESSLTIAGVTTVIDSGLARIARHDPWTGIQRLELEEISRARAVQRAGRAGRTSPGIAQRLYTAHNFDARPLHEVPELSRSNLSEILLLLRVAGIDETELPLLTELQPRAWEQAARELTALSALDDAGAVTPIGRRMLDFPLPVRLARVLVEGEKSGIFDEAALAVALLADRDILRSGRPFGARSASQVTAGDSDLDDRMQRFREAEAGRFSASITRELEVDPAGVRRVGQAYEQLRRSGPRQSPLSDDRLLTHALLTGFWDRVAERRGSGQDLVLMTGGSVRLSDTSAVLRAPFLLCLSADAPRGKQGGAIVRLAHRVDADTLLDVAGHHIETREEFVWSAEKERVEEISSINYGRITLDRTVGNARPSPGAASVLAKIARSKGAANFDPEARLETLSVRLGLLRAHAAEVFAALDDEERRIATSLADLETLVERALEWACQETTQLKELVNLDLAQIALGHIPTPLLRALDPWLPREVSLAGGLRVPVHYPTGRTPWIEARLQNFFGMVETPTLCRGRLPLQLHLLAPNRRAVQVTTDLSGFWQRHYPGLRKELMRRYPKHLWPEDGQSAAPPTPGKIR